MSPACTKPKGTNDNSPQKPRLQKVEGEEKSPSRSRGKEEEGGTEQASMKDLLEHANKMLKTLTASASTTSSTTSSGNEPRDEVVDRLQQQLNTLKLKVFKLSHWSHACSSSSATG